VANLRTKFEVSSLNRSREGVPNITEWLTHWLTRWHTHKLIL